MCGIFGWHITKDAPITRDQRIILATVLGLRNDTRGGDSWGGVVGKDLKVIRGLGDVVNGIREFIPYGRIMGHTRKATTGKVSLDNAHPFTIGHIIGGHNGMVYNHSELNKKYNRDCSVDSMHIFQHISEDKDISEIQGYGAIEYIDINQPEKVFLSRISSSGELSIFCMEGKKGEDGEAERVATFWSSNSAHALSALRAAGIEVVTIETKPGELYYVENGRVYIEQGKKMEVSTRVYSSGYTSGNYCGSGYYYGGNRSQGGYQGYNRGSSAFDMGSLLESIGDDADFDCFGKLAAYGEKDDVCTRCPKSDSCKAAIVAKCAKTDDTKKETKEEVKLQEDPPENKDGFKRPNFNAMTDQEIQEFMRGEYGVENTSVKTVTKETVKSDALSFPHKCEKCGGYDYIDKDWVASEGVAFCECADAENMSTAPLPTVPVVSAH